jgi:hypothetical protein
MCLACEMDALWFAEMEAAAPPGSAGVPPALKNHSASLTLGSLEGAGETPAVPGGVPPTASAPSPRTRGEEESTVRAPALPASRFRCEEARSE